MKLWVIKRIYVLIQYLRYPFQPRWGPNWVWKIRLVRDNWFVSTERWLERQMEWGEK